MSLTKFAETQIVIYNWVWKLTNHVYFSFVYIQYNSFLTRNYLGKQEEY